MLELVNYLEAGFGYAFMLSSLAQNLIKNGDLKKVTIKHVSDYSVEGYVVVDKRKLHKKQITSFIKSLNEVINNNFLV